MPPKSKRMIHLSKARDAKVQKLDLGSAGPSSAQDASAPTLSITPDATNDRTSVPGASGQSDQANMTEDECVLKHIESWTCTLSRDDQMSLSITLHYALVGVSGVPQNTAAALISSLIGKSERTVREWKYDFLSNGGQFSDTEQGKYRREGVIWQNEELNEAASDYVRKNAVVKGRPNMTSIAFCRWVNESLLPNSILDPGYPRSVSIETARKWLHELGFEVLDKKKGIYIDGHEREDVVQYRQRFLRQLVAGGFLAAEFAPSLEAKSAFPTDIDEPSPERREKNIFIFHDESTFNANDDEALQWGRPESQIIRPKSRGSGIMVSDFITEKDGYLCLTEEEYAVAHRNDSNIRMGARTKRLLDWAQVHETNGKCSENCGS